VSNELTHLQDNPTNLAVNFETGRLQKYSSQYSDYLCVLFTAFLQQSRDADAFYDLFETTVSAARSLSRQTNLGKILL